MTSEWLVPSTRSELIENLVSGVGLLLSLPHNQFVHETLLQTDTILPMCQSLKIISTTKFEVKNTIA